jgi:hypothetical protein
MSEQATAEVALECLEGPDGCRGEIKYRMALSPSGRAFPRCDQHWSQRLAREEDAIPWQSDVAPAWFDETACGERWNDD